jgi:16S rRNA (guanine966-N2)-methyltransferase
MKITSGEFAGIPLFTPKNYDIRPTLTKTRQSIFNMLRPNFSGSVCADIFCGTGAFGFEALSNGAAKAVFIDKTNRELILRNAEKLKVIKDKFEIMTCDYKKGISILKERGFKADIVFADPPYNAGYITNLLKNPGISDILNNNALLVLEMHRDERDDTEINPLAWDVIKDRKYGDAYALCLSKKAVAGQ